MRSEVIQHAERLWNYLQAGRQRDACDAIVVCCSYDLRVCDYACDLLRQGLAPQLILTGKLGNWTRFLWNVPEAQVFRERALQRGVDPGCIRLEEAATNFGENIAFVRRMLPEAQRITFVTKPNSVLRVALTIPVQWPGLHAHVDSPRFEFPHDVSQIVGVLGVIHEMVGDIDRIVRYPAQGFQTPHALPPDIMATWRALVAAGFTDHLLAAAAAAP